MNDRDLSRRQFLAGLSTAAKGSLIVLSLPAILTACRQANQQNPTASADAQTTILSRDLAIELDAISARIVPTDDAVYGGGARRWSPGSINHPADWHC